MALQLHTHMSHVSTTFSPIFSSHLPPPYLSLPRTSFKTHHQNSLFLISHYRSTNNTPSSPSNFPTKLLCGPALGESVEEDHLVRNFSAEEVRELIRGDRNVPLIIDFYAKWCGPCLLMAQQLETLAVEYEGNVMIARVDTDVEHEFARDMQVRGMPTLYFISPNPKRDAIRTEGLIPLKMIREILDSDV